MGARLGAVLHASVRREARELVYEGLADTPDLNLAWALGARLSVPFDSLSEEALTHYDTLVVTMRKIHERAREPSFMAEVPRFKRARPDLRVLVYQEAEHDWLGWRPDAEQRDFLANVRHADLFLAHTEDAAGFYGAVLGIPALAVPTLLRLDLLPASAEPEPLRVAVLATPDARARGLVAVAAVADVFRRVYEGHGTLVLLNRDGAAGSEARATWVAERFGRTERGLPYLSWSDYAAAINGCWLFVSAMTAAAAGRDAILSAAMGCPFVGTIDLDCVRELHSRTSVHPSSYRALRFRIEEVLRWPEEIRRDHVSVLRERARKDHDLEGNVERVRALVGEALG